MTGKLSLLAAVAIGYVLGAKAGRKRYDEIMGSARETWSSDSVQSRVDTAKQAVQARAPMVADKVGEAAKRIGSKVKKTSADLPETIQRATDGRVHADVSGFGPGPDERP